MAKKNSSYVDASVIEFDPGSTFISDALDDRISSVVPVLNSTIKMRGATSGYVSAQVTNTSYDYWDDSQQIYRKDMLLCNKAMAGGDSGGGAIGGWADGGRTNLIVAINQASNGFETVLIKGSYIIQTFK